MLLSSVPYTHSVYNVSSFTIQQKTIVMSPIKIFIWNIANTVRNHLFPVSGSTASTVYNAVSYQFMYNHSIDKVAILIQIISGV